jgi:hypothetical protein
MLGCAVHLILPLVNESSRVLNVGHKAVGRKRRRRDEIHLDSEHLTLSSPQQKATYYGHGRLSVKGLLVPTGRGGDGCGSMNLSF